MSTTALRPRDRTGWREVCPGLWALCAAPSDIFVTVDADVLVVSRCPDGGAHEIPRRSEVERVLRDFDAPTWARVVTTAAPFGGSILVVSLGRSANCNGGSA